MLRVYKFLIGIIFLYAIAHMVYTFFNEALVYGEETMWFFSGGMVVLYNGFIHLIHLKINNRFVRNTCFVTNSSILVFVLVLCFVIPELQVWILAGILLGAMIAAGFRWSGAFEKKKI